MRDHARRLRRPLAIVLLALVAGTILARRRGYPLGGNVVVRCQTGHLFTTIWVPGVSLKSLRLGWWRFQRCPVGRHWSIVTPVKTSTLSPDELQFATEHKDVRIP
jgi:hypothetical protein